MWQVIPVSTPEDKRFGNALAIGASTAALAGALLAGWFGSSVDFRICLGIATLGGGIAGFVDKSALRSRLLSAFSFVTLCVASTVAISMYLVGRSQVWNIELALPMLAGVAPFVIIRVLSPTLEKRFAPTAGVGLVEGGLASAILLVPLAALVFATPEVRAVQTRTTENEEWELALRLDAAGDLHLKDRTIAASDFDAFCQQIAAKHPNTKITFHLPPGGASRQVTGRLEYTAGIAHGLHVNFVTD